MSAVGISSSRWRYRGGLKKCVPSQCRRKSSLRPSASAAIGIPDVFELTIEPGRRAASTFSSSAALDVELLDDRLDNPVAVLDARELVEAAGRDQFPGIRREEGIRLERARALEPVPRGVGRDVEQQRGNAGVGEVRCNLRAHRPRAQDRHATE